MKSFLLLVGVAAWVATVGCAGNKDQYSGPAGGAYEGYGQSSGGASSQRGYNQGTQTEQAPRNYQGYTTPNPYPFH